MPFIQKMIYSGRILEIEKYPVSRKGARIPRNSKHKISTESQQNLNDKNAKKKFVRLVECNFTDDDLFISLKYDEKNVPQDEQKLKRDFQNFIRRLKYKCKKNNLPEPVYMAVSHFSEKRQRPHHHLLLNKYSWDFITKLWPGGSICISNLRKEEYYGFIQVSKYIMKDENANSFSKRWCASQNLKKPKIKHKEIKRLNIYKTVEPPKGYMVIDVEITDNVFTGVHQYIRCVKLE